MNADMRAQALMERRDELLLRLPRVLATARSLPESDREFAVDEAITYTAYEYADPVATPEELERVFWTACQYRVGDARRGRWSTVRAGWQRAPQEALDALAGASDPAGDVERSEDLAVVEELAATLGELERRVLRCKYDPGERDPLGCELIAQRLKISVAQARAAERSIQRAIEHFAAIYTAGRLCPNREPQIIALAAGAADRAQTRLARAHIAHCQHCRHAYAEQLRAFRSAAFQRKIAALLPLPAEPQARGRLRGAWDAVADTLTRPFAHDSTAATAAQLAASGAGRGAGTIAALKVAGACMVSATAVGVCASTFVAPVFNNNDPRPVKAAPKKPKRSETRPKPAEREPPLPHGAATPTATATAKPAKRRASQRRTRKSTRTSTGATQGGSGPTDHENTPASPAPANAAPGGASEFDPTYQPSAPQPAPAPAAPGASEFGFG